MSPTVTDILQVLGGAAVIYVVATTILTLFGFLLFGLLVRWMMKQ